MRVDLRRRRVGGGWRRRLVAVLALPLWVAFAAVTGDAQEAAGIPEHYQADPYQLIGWSLMEAFTQLPVPQAVFSVRGETADADDVVFFYGEHVYLFWFGDRVWQVRYDSSYTGDVMGVRIGDDCERVIAVLGQPLLRTPSEMIVQLPERRYPTRARLFFEQDALIDMYVYRSDW